MANTTALWSRRLLIYQSGVQPLNKADQSRVANESLFPVRKVTAVAAAMMTFGGEALPPPPVNPFVGKTSYPDSVVHRKFSAAQQQYATFSRPIAVATPGWEGAQFEFRFAKPLPVAQQQYAGWHLSPPPISAPSMAWITSSPLIARYVNISGDGGELAGFISPQSLGWWSESPPRFAKSISASLLPFDVQARGNIPSPVHKDGWRSDLAYRFLAPYPAANQRFDAAFNSTPPPTATGIGEPGDFSSVLRRPLIVYQASVLPLKPVPAVPAVATPGWEGAQLECRFAKPLPVAQQQYAAFQPRGTINSTTPQGWWPLYPDLFAKPFPSPSQQFATFSRPIAIATPGWEGAQLDYRVQAKPFPVGSQQYTGFLLGFPPAPQGWAGYQLTYQFKASYPVAAQQFLALLQPRTADPSNTTTWRQQPLNPEPIKSLYPPALQQYEARGLPIIVPPTPDTTNLPGHGDWPRHVKKQKVRPVWDRRPDPISEGSPKTAAPAAAPIEAKAPAPQARNDGEGSPYLSRVLVPAEPPVVAQEKPAQKAKPLPRRKASVLADDVDSAAAYGTATVTARAEFSDDEDASSGSVTATHQAFVLGIDWDESITRRARARIEVEEESDTLSAEASWNDDDIALGLLLGDL